MIDYFKFYFFATVNFFGNACQYMSCDAGGGGSSGQSPCSGNGACLSMSELALRSLKNGVRTNYTYGLDPNNAHTWDKNRIFGCYCDEGYEGDKSLLIQL